MWVQSLGGEDPLEEEMAIHSSILAGRIPWTEEPGGLQSIGSQRTWLSGLRMHIHSPGHRQKGHRQARGMVRPQRLSSGTSAGTFKKWVDDFYLGCGVDRLQVQSSLWLSLSQAHRKSLPESKGNTKESRAERRKESDFWKCHLLETRTSYFRIF